MSDDEFDDDVFDNADVVEDMLRSSQAPNTQQSLKRNLDGALERNGENSAKRVKSEPHAQPHNDTGHDVENVALARRLLKQKFGYKSFRHEQEDAIRRILTGQSALVIFPTGAGKSLCYQIPGIAFPELDETRGLREPGNSGITIVISPLIALMKDQVDVLKRREIAAECIDSTKTWEQLQEIQMQLSRGELRIVYCSPERLNNERFVVSMKHVPGGVRLVAVDEAHCISEWGHSFRPEYLKVARFVEEIKAERVICLTATATARVAEDVCRAFNIDPAGVFRTTPYRPNLNLSAESLEKPAMKFSKICAFLRSHPGPTLIYVTVQREADELAEKLQEKKFRAVSFHAGKKNEDKTKIQDDFMANKIDIVVATIAFGMGVDKSDIRNVIHSTLPATIEEYSQQVGRAGRDGKISECMLYLCNSDFWIRENFARGDLPSYEPFRNLIGNIFDNEVTKLGVGDTFKKNPNEQMKEFDIRQSPLSVIYATLELRFNLIRAITPEYSSYQWETTRPGLYKEVMANMQKSDRPEARAIERYADKKVKFTYLDVNQVVRETGYHRADLIQILDHMDRDGIIRLTAKGVMPKFRVLKKLPKTANELDDLAKEMYVDLERKEKDALLRTKEVVDLITGKKCFAQALAQHFGMCLPGNKERCGHCTFCGTGESIILPPKEQRPLDLNRVKAVLADCPVRDDPRFLARVAFGIMSPRVRELKMNVTGAWESMVDQDFEQLLQEFTAACRTAKLEPNSRNPISTSKPITSSSSSRVAGRSSSWRGSSSQSSRDSHSNRGSSSQSYSSGRGGYSSRGSSTRGRYGRC